MIMISDGSSVRSASTEPHHGPDLFLVLVPRKEKKQNPSPESCPIFFFTEIPPPSLVYAYKKTF
jgi:hypothetical protein